MSTVGDEPIIPQRQSHEPDPRLDLQGELYSQKEYEFTPEEDTLIYGMAGKMKGVGGFMVLLGIINLALPFVLYFALHSPKFRVSPLVAALVFLLVGKWTRSAATSFAKIRTTSGRDIKHLMVAMSDLDSVYSLQYWLMIVALVVAVAVVGFVLVIDATVGSAAVISF